jgi:hypothetical protein
MEMPRTGRASADYRGVDEAGLLARVQAGYAHALSKRPNGAAWIRFLSETLPRLPQDRVRTTFISALSKQAKFTDNSLLRQHAKFSVVSAQEESAIIGRPIFLPMLEFTNLTAYTALAQALGMRPPQGFASFFPMHELESELGIQNASNVGAIGMFVSCVEPVPGSLGLKQIKRHEKKHLIDPILHSRQGKESLLISELVATIGEFAGMGAHEGSAILNTRPTFWARYLGEIVQKQKGLSTELLDVLKPFSNEDRPTLDGLAKATTEYVRALTRAHDNSILTVLLMNCTSSVDLLELSKTLLPKQYEKPALEPHTTTTKLSQEAHEKLQLAIDHYRNWPKAYTFSNRSLSSLWQKQPYAEQAMSPFLSSDPQLSLIALSAIAEISGKTFDLSNIRRFKVTGTPAGQNYEITLTW